MEEGDDLNGYYHLSNFNIAFGIKMLIFLAHCNELCKLRDVKSLQF